MEKLNTLPLAEKRSIIQNHGIFLESPKNERGEYAIYVMDRTFDFCYAIMFTDTRALRIYNITFLENWEVADFINVGLKNLFARN